MMKPAAALADPRRALAETLDREIRSDNTKKSNDVPNPLPGLVAAAKSGVSSTPK
jgi:hypothetical protein